MAPRRHPALPTLALAAALGATALTTTAAAATAAADNAAARSTGTHSASGFPSSYGDVKDWNTMVPEGGHPAQAS